MKLKSCIVLLACVLSVSLQTLQAKEVPLVPMVDGASRLKIAKPSEDYLNYLKTTRSSTKEKVFAQTGVFDVECSYKTLEDGFYDGKNHVYPQYKIIDSVNDIADYGDEGDRYSFVFSDKAETLREFSKICTSKHKKIKFSYFRVRSVPASGYVFEVSLP